MPSDKLVVTNSSRATYRECPMKYYWRYVRMLSSPPTATLAVGNVVHEGLAMLLQKEKLATLLKKMRAFIKEKRAELIGPELDKFEKDATILEGMILAWDKHRGLMGKAKVYQWDGEPAVEVPFELELPTCVYAGKMDSVHVMKKRIWLGEHKTAQMVGTGYVDRLTVDCQVVGYEWALDKLLGKKCAGCIYNVLGKPGIRQRTKKNPETPAQFTTRLMNEFKTNATQYLYSTALERREEDIERWPMVLAEFVKEVEHCKEIDYWPVNDRECVGFGTCPYLPLCSRGESKLTLGLFTKRDVMHPELEEEE